jgi:hypothetical protein
LHQVLVGDKRLLPGVDPPTLVQATDVEGIEAELVVEIRNELLGVKVIT